VLLTLCEPLCHINAVASVWAGRKFGGFEPHLLMLRTCQFAFFKRGGKSAANQ